MSQSGVGYQLPEALDGTILEKIVASKLRELAGIRKKFGELSVETTLKTAPRVIPFREALTSTSPAVIAEIKRASPSTGVIREEFDPRAVAREYFDAGAAALSVITERDHFRGSLEILTDVRRSVRLPLLRKDFIIDSCQIQEARAAGADAVLLIAALLMPDALKSMRMYAERLGMDALIEVHDEAEAMKALDAGASLVGVNNRDLRTFEVSLDVSFKLAGMMPPGVTMVAESGIRTAEDIRRLSDAGFQGYLVGEHLMRAPSPGKALSSLLGKES
ncbi:MAG TPA: indole-3-glycerol phosphate synthase TrpC [Acidobacteriota bacterium]|nr:indole-3-glycerol phosphate synthase TrpC [Acidobacteriota bacterium]